MGVSFDHFVEQAFLRSRFRERAPAGGAAQPGKDNAMSGHAGPAPQPAILPRRLARLGLSWPVAAKAFIAALFVLACAESSSLGIRPWIHASRSAAVLLTADGRILLDGSPVSIEELRDQLETAKAADPSFRARLAGEAGTPPSLVRSVADLCLSLGVVEGLATKPLEP